MNNQIQLFNFEGNDVRTLTINGNPYFVGRDVTSILGYSNGPKAIRDHVDEEDKTVNESFTVNGTAPVLINESGVYSLIILSKLPSAKEFKRWVTSEVLPAIRKNGVYMTDQKAFDLVNNPNNLSDLLQQAADQLRDKDIKIQEMQPKALFADAVSASEDTILVRELAKILTREGFKIGQDGLFTLLQETGWLIKAKANDHNMPTQKALNQGLIIAQERIVFNNGKPKVTKTPRITGKGQVYFVNKFLKMFRDSKKDQDSNSDNE